MHNNACGGGGCQNLRKRAFVCDGDSNLPAHNGTMRKMQGIRGFHQIFFQAPGQRLAQQCGFAGSHIELGDGTHGCRQQQGAGGIRHGISREWLTICLYKLQRLNEAEQHSLGLPAVHLR